MENSKELDLAIKAAKAAGEFLAKRENVHVEMLEGKDIKLSSDKMSEKIIMDILREGGLPILSEEYGRTEESGNEYWIIDPLDGTINYYKGLDEMACVSIALWRDNRPSVGVVYRFIQDELFYGEEGKGAYLNGQPINPSDIREISQAVLATGFPVKRSYDTDSLTAFIKQVQDFKKVRMLGTAAIMGVFVACGRFDVYLEEEIMIWDVAAAVAITKAAGGYASLKLLDNNKCICRCFATRELADDFYFKNQCYIEEE